MHLSECFNSAKQRFKEENRFQKKRQGRAEMIENKSVVSFYVVCEKAWKKTNQTKTEVAACWALRSRKRHIQEIISVFYVFTVFVFAINHIEAFAFYTPPEQLFIYLSVPLFFSSQQFCLDLLPSWPVIQSFILCLHCELQQHFNTHLCSFARPSVCHHNGETGEIRTRLCQETLT